MLGFADAPQVYFSPKDQLADRLIEMIAQETKSVHIAIYCFTHREIGKALVAAKKRGVDVQMLVDPFSVKTRTPIARMAQEGIPIYVWSPPQVKDAKGKPLRTPLLHDKFCVFGSKKVWTGSFNFTYEANRAHAENALVIDDPKIAAAFESEFQLLKKKCSTAL